MSKGLYAVLCTYVRSRMLNFELVMMNVLFVSANVSSFKIRQPYTRC